MLSFIMCLCVYLCIAWKGHPRIPYRCDVKPYLLPSLPSPLPPFFTFCSFTFPQNPAGGCEKCSKLSIGLRGEVRVANVLYHTAFKMHLVL